MPGRSTKVKPRGTRAGTPARAPTPKRAPSSTRTGAPTRARPSGAPRATDDDVRSALASLEQLGTKTVRDGVARYFKLSDQSPHGRAAT